VFASERIGKTDGKLMLIKLEQVFDDVFEHLGVEIIFKSRTSEPVSIVALVKEPEGVYEIGGSQVIGQVAEIAVKAADVTPKTGDTIEIIACAASTGSKKYKIHEEPLLDGSNIVWKFQAVLVEK
jgi:hypothetical protein